jgi:hypothetical protein
LKTKFFIKLWTLGSSNSQYFSYIYDENRFMGEKTTNLSQVTDKLYVWNYMYKMYCEIIIYMYKMYCEIIIYMYKMYCKIIIYMYKMYCEIIFHQTMNIGILKFTVFQLYLWWEQVYGGENHKPITSHWQTLCLK